MPRTGGAAAQRLSAGGAPRAAVLRAATAGAAAATSPRDAVVRATDGEARNSAMQRSNALCIEKGQPLQLRNAWSHA